MGARSFMLAARIPMSRDGFDEWLRTPLPGLDIIENPSAMYAGWAADGAAPDWDLTETAAHSPQAVAGIRADRDKTPLQLLALRATGGFNLLRHRDEALEVYLYDYHGEATSTQTDLLMLAGAGRFAHRGTETPVMYWGGDIYPGLPVPGDEPLAVMLVTSTRARFVDTYPLDALITDLTPIETDFLTATEDEDPARSSPDLLDPALRAQPTELPCPPPLSTKDH
ncbi:hypothetical protein SAMN06272735_8519 [Streptomyces sp. TLI_55]|uniref:hypothetical protein n=1 Tax=Streptomyces sp. TLI_55 TaxID=1938861 RepID=UPI000BD2D4A1|nr:hypothetical protein [Streptomyces sp. TLI_55]SNX66622.1 hypothetical protein SAMN06272735_8519 [Streptomyces sp. TLI_55]